MVGATYSHHRCSLALTIKVAEVSATVTEATALLTIVAETSVSAMGAIKYAGGGIPVGLKRYVEATPRSSRVYFFQLLDFLYSYP